MQWQPKVKTSHGSHEYESPSDRLYSTKTLLYVVILFWKVQQCVYVFSALRDLHRLDFVFLVVVVLFVLFHFFFVNYTTFELQILWNFILNERIYWFLIHCQVHCIDKYLAFWHLDCFYPIQKMQLHLLDIDKERRVVYLNFWKTCKNKSTNNH